MDGYFRGIMKSGRKRMLRTMGVVVAGMVVSGASASATHVCADAAAERLTALGFAPADVPQIAYVDETDGGRSGNRLIGYQVWAAPSTCQGSIVLQLRLDCTPRQIYTRGNCRAPGIKHFR